MHSIDLVRLRFSNILSYGNNINEVTFKKGVTWISGPNGVGKSTILEVMYLLFFNKPYRNIKKEQLKNTANKSNLFVEGEFIRTDSKSSDKYVISRTMTGSGSTKTVMYKNDVLVPKEASVSQKVFEEEILGFNTSIWENIISLNTISTVPFIDMEPKDKRELMESVLVLCIDKWKDLNKIAYKDAMTKFDSATSDVVKYDKDRMELATIISQMEAERANNILELKEEVEILEVSLVEATKIAHNTTLEYNAVLDSGKEIKAQYDLLSTVDSELVKYNNVISVFPLIKTEEAQLVALLDNAPTIKNTLDVKKKLVDSIDVKTLNSKSTELNALIKDGDKKVSSYQTTMAINTTTLEGITAKANALVAGIPCHTCGKPSTENDVETIKKSYREEYKALKKTNDVINIQCVELSKLLDSYEAELVEIKSKLAEYTGFYEDYSNYERNTYNPLITSIDAMERSINNKKTLIANAGVGSVIEATEKVEELNAKLAQKRILETELNDLRVKAATQKQIKLNADTNVTVITSTIASKKAIIAEKSVNSNIEDSLNSTIKKLQNVEKDLNTAKERVVKYSDEIEITKYIDSMCSDKGMKKIVLNIFVPNLNRAIMDNMKIFDLPYIVEFDETMKYTFTSRYGLAEVYNGLSEGQKRKINFAIAMAFRDFVTRIADFKINILFLDEVLDISTDAEALRDMVMLLKNKIEEIGSIYLITHRGSDITECFDNKIEVSHDGRYSSLREVSLAPTRTKY